MPAWLFPVKEINYVEKFILISITNMDKGDGCFADSEHFTEFFSITHRYLNKCLANLVFLGYLKMEKVRKQKLFFSQIDMEKSNDFQELQFLTQCQERNDSSQKRNYSSRKRNSSSFLLFKKLKETKRRKASPAATPTENGVFSQSSDSDFSAKSTSGFSVEQDSFGDEKKTPFSPTPQHEREQYGEIANVFYDFYETFHQDKLYLTQKDKKALEMLEKDFTAEPVRRKCAILRDMIILARTENQKYWSSKAITPSVVLSCWNELLANNTRPVSGFLSGQAEEVSIKEDDWG